MYIFSLSVSLLLLCLSLSLALYFLISIYLSQTLTQAFKRMPTFFFSLLSKTPPPPKKKLDKNSFRVAFKKKKQDVVFESFETQKQTHDATFRGKKKTEKQNEKRVTALKFLGADPRARRKREVQK